MRMLSIFSALVLPALVSAQICRQCMMGSGFMPTYASYPQSTGQGSNYIPMGQNSNYGSNSAMMGSELGRAIAVRLHEMFPAAFGGFGAAPAMSSSPSSSSSSSSSSPFSMSFSAHPTFSVPSFNQRSSYSSSPNQQSFSMPSPNQQSFSMPSPNQQSFSMPSPTIKKSFMLSLPTQQTSFEAPMDRRLQQHPPMDLPSVQEAFGIQSRPMPMMNNFPGMMPSSRRTIIANNNNNGCPFCGDYLKAWKARTDRKTRKNAAPAKDVEVSSSEAPAKL